MVGRQMTAANFPDGRIEVTDVDDVASYIADFNAIAHPVGSSSQDINPADEAGDRRLQGESKNQRDQSERYDSRIPVDEQHRNRNKERDERCAQSYDPFQIEARHGAAQAAND